MIKNTFNLLAVLFGIAAVLVSSTPVVQAQVTYVGPSGIPVYGTAPAPTTNLQPNTPAYVGPAGIPVYTPFVTPVPIPQPVQNPPSYYYGPSGIPVYFAPNTTPTQYCPGFLGIPWPCRTNPPLPTPPVPCYCPLIVGGPPCSCNPNPRPPYYPTPTPYPVVPRPTPTVFPTIPQPTQGGPSYYYSPAGIPVYLTRTASAAQIQPPLATPLPVPQFSLGPAPSFSLAPSSFPSLPRFSPRPADGVYVILGDSIAAGAYGFPSYPNIYEDNLENTNQKELDSRNLARSGWHSSHLAAALQQDPLFQQNIAEADVITINIGGNDLRAARDQYYAGTCGGADNQDCLRRAVRAFDANWDVITSEINSRKPAGAIVRVTDLYNPYVREDMAQGTFSILQPYFDQVNTQIYNSGLPVAQVRDAFNGSNGLTDPADLGFISADGYHPNSAGHRVIAAKLAELGTSLP
ncbi:MAG: SGNH/GDSL hydrolase family protein [Candidatus Andersenbacteria bacterium]|nr:SGNH/GDSL hydrolase family protein [Candidatus Andersenbacteria bacterium]MBI3250706.1 SGNH/GDSL hydrolase family protein [Candidatus Andersenbacteria bacterium]